MSKSKKIDFLFSPENILTPPLRDLSFISVFFSVPAHQLNSAFRTRGAIQSIPEGGTMSFTEVPHPQLHYDHHQSMTQLHSTSFGHHNPPGLSNKQWHSCADINAEQGHFSEPLSEFTLNQSSFRDDIFIHSPSPKRDRHYGHLHEQYTRDFAPVPHGSYHDAYTSYGSMNSGSYTSLPMQPSRPESRGRSASPSRSPPRIRSPGKTSGSKSPIHKLLPAKSLFEPLKDPRLETSHGSHHYDSSNYSVGSSVSNRDSIQSLEPDPPTITNDLTQWQQKHQMQLKRQQIDTSQVSLKWEN
jgi:hypothetical protein